MTMLEYFKKMITTSFAAHYLDFNVAIKINTLESPLTSIVTNKNRKL